MTAILQHTAGLEARVAQAATGRGGQPLDILFLTHYFPPEGNAPASRTYEVCKRWVRAGHRVRVITCAPNAPAGVIYDGYRNRLLHRSTVDGIEVIRVWTYIAANRRTIRRTINFVSYMVSALVTALCVRKPDVVIATSPQFFCGIAGGLVRWVRRVPFILEIRDIWPESIASVGAVKRRWAIRVLEAMERWMYRSAHHIVTVGDGYREQLERRRVPADRISIVTNGVDPDLFSPRAPSVEVRQRHGLGQSFVCAYVGTIGLACGLEVVLRAAKLLIEKGRRDIKFLLVGDGAMRESLQTQAQAEGLDNVVFTGRLPKESVPDYLASTDACLVHLKRQDLFRYVLPSKIFEAAGMGKPIVMGVEGHAADLVRQAGAGVMMEPENADELVRAVETLAGDQGLAARLGASGQQFVLRNYTRDTLSAAYLEIVDCVAQGRHPRRLAASSPPSAAPAAVAEPQTLTLPPVREPELQLA